MKIASEHADIKFHSGTFKVLYMEFNAIIKPPAQLNQERKRNLKGKKAR